LRDFSTCHERYGAELRLCRLLLAATGLWLFGGNVQAAGGPRAISQYLQQQLTSDQGLTGIVTSIAQTPDGYLWVGTDSALLRFDGQTFSPVKISDPGMKPITHVLSLAVDEKGALWIWMLGMPVVQYEDGKFQYGFSAAEPVTGTSAMANTKDGGVLMSISGQRIVRFGGGTMEHVGRSPGPLVVSLAQTTDDKVWLGTRDAGLFYLEGGISHTPVGKLPDKKVNCLIGGSDGQLWIGTDDGLALWDGKAISTLPMPAPLDHAQVFSLMQDRQGSLWVGTQYGLVRYDRAGIVSVASGFGKKEAPVTAIFEDREDNIWVSAGKEIKRLREGVFSTFSSIEGLPGDAYGPVYVDAQERVWFAPLKGGLYWMRDGKVHRVDREGLNSDIVYSIDGGKDGIWVGRQTGGLTHLRLIGDSVSAETLKFHDDIYDYVIYTVHEDRDESVWIGTLTGGARHIVKGVVQTFSKRDGLGSDSVSAIEEGNDGAMYFGTPDGLSVLNGEHWSHYAANRGLPSKVVTTLFSDRQGTLWVGTENGLAYMSGGVAHSVAERALQLHERILGIAEDQKDMLWISTARRIMRVNRASLLHPALDPGDIREYGIADGLRGFGDPRRSRTIISDPMDRVWVSTMNGLSVVDRATSIKQSASSITHIEAAIVNGQSVALGGERLSTSAQKRLGFHFSGLSFSTPGAVRFRYRLDGFDHAWSGPTAERDAVYTNLSPGQYRFRVMSSSGDGNWSDDEASVPFEIAPFFWQRWEFTLVCILCAISASVVFYQLRMRAIIGRAGRRFDAQLAERTRIAQELHDTLLQGFFSASMQLRVVVDQIPENSGPRPQLDRILRLMGKVLDEGREAVYGLRATDDKPIWLEEMFHSFFRELGDEERVTYSISSEGGSRELRSGVQEEICRISQEALRNAHRHAQAKSVDVRIRYSVRVLTIEIRDDGCGIEPEVLAHGRAGHWGFLGMRERSESIGGKLRIANNEPRGAAVTLCVPGSIAYRKYSRNVALNWMIHLLHRRSARSPPQTETRAETTSSSRRERLWNEPPY
jgi:ligand-binding sensor domain-containing protein/signal transduction histidine kinase